MEARRLQRATFCQVIAAKDGMVINPAPHASRIRQKTLNIFKGYGNNDSSKIYIIENAPKKEDKVTSQKDKQQFLDGFSDIKEYLGSEFDDEENENNLK
jgi:hypothetical protein